jgi:signal transduction histidine kinase
VRRTLALLASAAALLVAGCGHSSSQRPAVARYIQRVDSVEAELAAPLASVTQLGAQFARQQGLGGSSLSGFVAQGTISGALGRIVAVRRQLAAIPAPAPAGRLRSLLLQVVDGQIRLTRELGKLIVFLPRFSHALAPLGPAMQRLEGALSQQSAYGTAAVAAVYADKAAALRSFQAELQRILGQLRRLQPPAVSKPDYDAQISALKGMSANAGRLAGAIAQGPQGNVQPLLTAFDQAAASAQSQAVQRAHAAAVKSYNGQIARISNLSEEANRERLRLANELH